MPWPQHQAHGMWHDEADEADEPRHGNGGTGQHGGRQQEQPLGGLDIDAKGRGGVLTEE